MRFRFSLRVLDTWSISRALRLPVSLAVPLLACRCVPRSPCAHLPLWAGRWLWEVTTKDLQQLQGLLWRASQWGPWCARLHHQTSDTMHPEKLLTFGATGPPTPMQNCHEQGMWLHVLPPSHIALVPTSGGDTKAGRAALSSSFPQIISITIFPHTGALCSAAAYAIQKPEEDKVTYMSQKGYASRYLIHGRVCMQNGVQRGSRKRSTGTRPGSAFVRRLCAAERAENLSEIFCVLSV